MRNPSGALCDQWIRWGRRATAPGQFEARLFPENGNVGPSLPNPDGSSFAVLAGLRLSPRPPSSDLAARQP